MANRVFVKKASQLKSGKVIKVGTTPESEEDDYSKLIGLGNVRDYDEELDRVLNGHESCLVSKSKKTCCAVEINEGSQRASNLTASNRAKIGIPSEARVSVELPEIPFLKHHILHIRSVVSLHERRLELVSDSLLRYRQSLGCVIFAGHFSSNSHCESE